jgi:hypothetical protein
MPARKRPTTPKFTVPEVWRSIVKKNERQGELRFDVLVCTHAVPANDNTYRRARSCPECRMRVQEYADRLRAPRSAIPSPVKQPPRARRRARIA